MVTRIKIITLFSLLFSMHINALEYSEENMELATDITITSEGYFHTNSDYLNWQYNFFDRKPLINIELDFTFYDYFNAVVELPIMKDRLIAERDTENYSNILTNFSQLDMNFPNRAFLSIGNRNLNFSLGRDLLTLGGGLLLKPNTFHHDFVRFSTNWERFNYGYTFLSLNETGFPIDDDGEAVEVRVSTTKYLIAHDIGITLFDCLSINFIESVLLQDMDFDVKFLNPFLILHDEFLSVSDMANAFSTLYVVYTPLETLKLFGELAIDQYATTYESENWEKVEPNAIGWLLGLEGTIPVFDYFIKAEISFVHTDPYLGLDSSGINFTTTKNYVTHSQPDDEANGIPVTDFLGIGPDRQILELNIDILGVDRLLVGLDYTFIRQGDNDSSPESGGNEDNFKKTTPSGEVSIFNVVTLKAGYDFTKYLNLYAQVSNVNQDSINDVQLILSLSYTF